MTEFLTGEGKESYRRLVELLSEVATLQQVGQLLFWDQQTHMPPGGARARGNHMAAVRKLSHEKLTSPEVGRALEALTAEEASLPYDSDEASTIRVARRDYERATKFPPEFVVRLSRAQSTAYSKWLEARSANQYSVFLPALRELTEVMREAATIQGYAEHPLDALLDQTETGIRVSHLEPLFADLRATLVPLVKAISTAEAVDDRVLRQPFDRDTQLQASREAIAAIGFDLQETGRMDLSVHPFTTCLSPTDVRITTRAQDDFFSACFFACLHEAGHGTYMRGVPLKFETSILADGASAGMHESQSRLWENLVGRSRAFWEFFYPRLVKFFPAQLEGVSVETFYRAINKVEPSLIRVEADEVTYNLHIMVRFELEKAVFDGKLALEDMPEAWAAKIKDYLGVTPPDDLSGCLQDIHWTFVFGAGFPGYTIGNVASVQLFEEARKEFPDLEERFAAGEFSHLLGWMNRNVHERAAKFTPQELLQRVTGRPLTAAPYLAYIKRKFSEIYGL